METEWTSKQWNGLPGGAPAGLLASVEPVEFTLPDLVGGQEFALRIGNLNAISVVYGAAFADSVSGQICSAFEVFIASDPDVFGLVKARGSGVYDLTLVGRDPSLPLSRSKISGKVAIWCSSLGRRPFACNSRVVHVAIFSTGIDLAAIGPVASAGVLLADAHARLECAHFAGTVRLDGFAGYQQDMAIVADLYDQLSRNQLQFVWRPVKGLDGDCLLYNRGVLSALRPDGGVQEWEASRKAMIRLGLAAAFDQQAVLWAVGLLAGGEVGPLGVSVAASVFHSSGWWEPVLARLKANRAAARRLFIAIDGTDPFVSVSAAAALVDELRSLGCVIVFERMGNDSGSIASLLALRPDVITLEAMFLRLSLQSPRDFELLRHLFGVAGVIAPVVVLEGVDTVALAENARLVGAHWGVGEEVGAARWVVSGSPESGAAWHITVDRFRTRFALPRYAGEMS